MTKTKISKKVKINKDGSKTITIKETTKYKRTKKEAKELTLSILSGIAVVGIAIFKIFGS